MIHYQVLVTTDRAAALRTPCYDNALMKTAYSRSETRKAGPTAYGRFSVEKRCIATRDTIRAFVILSGFSNLSIES